MSHAEYRVPTVAKATSTAAETNMTNEYIEQERKKSIVKMAAARTLQDSAKTKTARDSALDDYLFWQNKLAFFDSELRAKALRSTP